VDDYHFDLQAYRFIRPCHTAVHNVARGEELARHYYTVELLLEREDIQKWQKYAAKQRFGVKRG